MACLDRYFANNKWSLTYSTSFTSSFSRGYSNHSPIVLTFGSNTNFQQPSCRFNKSWIKQEGFLDLLKEWWSQLSLGSNLGKG